MANQQKYFFEVDERGIVNKLSPLACGQAPFGETVYAETASMAAELASQYYHGAYWLKKTLYLGGYDNTYRNVIYA